MLMSNKINSFIFFLLTLFTYTIPHSDVNQNSSITATDYTNDHSTETSTTTNTKKSTWTTSYIKNSKNNKNAISDNGNTSDSDNNTDRDLDYEDSHAKNSVDEHSNNDDQEVTQTKQALSDCNTEPDCNADSSAGSSSTNLSPLSAQSQALSKQIAREYTKLIIDIQHQFIRQTRTNISFLLAMINNNQIPSLKNKDALKTYLTYLLEITKDFQTNKFIGINPPLVVSGLLDINEALMLHISKALTKGLSTLEPLPIEKIVTQFQQSQATLRSRMTIPTLIEHNTKLLQKLSKQIEHAGLRWYNHAYRTVDSTVVEPLLTYGHYGLMAGGLSAGALLAWWNLAHESFKNNMPENVYDAFGPVPGTQEPLLYAAGHPLHNLPVLDSYGYPVSRPIPSDRFTKIGKLVGLVNSNTLLTAGLITGYYKDWIIKQWSEDVKPKLERKVSAIRNRLKGGIHNKIADQLDGIIETVTFKDLIGLDDVIEKFQLIINYMENPEFYSQFGTVPDKGYLLVGPPRTGKTMVVLALFNEIARICKAKGITINVLHITPSELARRGIKGIFHEAEAKAPCLVFIDEIDTYGLQRGVASQGLNEFLTGMSGLMENKDPKKMVIMIAATNKPETLDFALKQPGRFGTEIRFKLPSLTVRKKTLKRRLEKLALDFPGSEHIINKIALETAGVSFEALNKLVNEAFIHARRADETFGAHHLEKALNDSIRKITAYLNETIPSDEQQLMATHFAGQALAVILLNSVTKLACVTILPHMPALLDESLWRLAFAAKEEREKEQDRYKYGNIYTYKENDTVDATSYAELLNECKIQIAGIVAEEMIYGQASYTCNRDAMTNALNIAKTITFEGINEEKLPKEERLRRFKQAQTLVSTCKKEIRALLQKHQDTLKELITEIQEKKFLSSAQVQALVKPEVTNTETAKIARTETVRREVEAY